MYVHKKKYIQESISFMQSDTDINNFIYLLLFNISTYHFFLKKLELINY